MTTHPTPLPPTVAELHNDIMHEFAWLSENWQGKLRKWLDKLCRRAADPALVADSSKMVPVLYWLEEGKFARAMLVGHNQLVVDLTSGDGPSVVGKQDWFDAGYVSTFGGLVPESAEEGTQPGQWSYGVAALPAPVADEAAIAAWDKAMNEANNSGKPGEIDRLRREGKRLMRAAPRNDDGRLRKLREEMQAEWLECIENKKQFPVGSGDRRECQAEANAFQSACFRIDRLLAESPAGDAGESGSRKRSFDPHGVAGKLRLIASGLTYNEGKAEGVAKHWIYEVAWRIQAGLDHVPDEKRMRGEINDLRETVSAQQQTIDKLLAESPAGDAVGLFGDDKLRSEIAAKWGHAGAHVEVFDDLRARLQAAEADLAAAKSIYREHWDDCETVAEMMRSACNEAMTRLVQFKQRGGLIDKLEADLAAAQREVKELYLDLAGQASWAVISTNDYGLSDIRRVFEEMKRQLDTLRSHLQSAEEDLAAAQKERDVAVTGARDFRAAWEREKRWREDDRAAAKAEGARAVVEIPQEIVEWAELWAKGPQADNWPCRTAKWILSLRAAQPQPTKPATVRQGDEVLREVVTMPFADLIAEEDAKRYYRMVTLCLKELARRALEGKP